MVIKARKKPIVVDVVEFNDENWAEVTQFLDGVANSLIVEGNDPLGDVIGVEINTLEGVMTAAVGDYIIKGVNGEFYPCKPDIFEKTYEKVNE